MSELDRAARQARWAVAGTGVAAALAVVRYVLDGTADSAGRGSVAGGLVSLALLVSGIFWVTWFRLLFEPLEDRGRTRFVGWRFWGWVIPGIDLVIPKMMVNDVLSGASAGERGPAPWQVQVWWVLWVASRAVTYRSWDAPSRNDEAGLAFGVLYLVLLAAAAPFAVATISTLTRRRAVEEEQ